MSHWRTTELAPPNLSQELHSLDAVFALTGRRITSDPLSEVLLLERDGVRYYLKRYWGAGKGLRRYLGRPRVKAEWQNLKHFARWGIPTAPIMGFGLERQAGVFSRGALITQELRNTQDMAALAKVNDPCLRDPQWVAQVSRQLAQATRVMHEHGFAHNDLKWRNLLVDDQRRLFFIDCPTGSFWWGPFLRYRIIKDLACLDKVASQVLSRTQRLRFYLQYSQQQRLSAADKRRVRAIIKFFEGRE